MYIREFHRGIDSPSTCGNCNKEVARIVIENFPVMSKHASLCQECAATALSEHPKLLASAVLTLILRGEPVKA